MAGFVLSFFGVGALTSIGGGWIGDKFSPRVVLSSAYLGIAVLGYLFFLQSPSPLMREILTFIYGVVGSAVLYVNLAGYHVKAVRGHLASRGSGLFVTSLYGAAAFAGYAIGALASRGRGWRRRNCRSACCASLARCCRWRSGRRKWRFRLRQSRARRRKVAKREKRRGILRERGAQNDGADF